MRSSTVPLKIPAPSSCSCSCLERVPKRDSRSDCRLSTVDYRSLSGVEREKSNIDHRKIEYPQAIIRACTAFWDTLCLKPSRSRSRKKEQELFYPKHPVCLWFLLLLCCCPGYPTPTPAARVTHGQYEFTTLQAQQAERVLTRAEQHPPASGALLRRAAALAPAYACPSLKTAMAKPTRENITQARREVAACARVMALDSSRAGAPPARHTPRDVLRTVLGRGEFQILKPTAEPRWLRVIRGGWNWLGHQIARGFEAFKSFMARLFGHVHPRTWHAQPRWMTRLSKLIRWVLYGVLAGGHPLFSHPAGELSAASLTQT